MNDTSLNLCSFDNHKCTYNSNTTFWITTLKKETKWAQRIFYIKKKTTQKTKDIFLPCARNQRLTNSVCPLLSWHIYKKEHDHVPLNVIDKNKTHC